MIVVVVLVVLVMAIIMTGVMAVIMTDIAVVAVVKRHIMCADIVAVKFVAYGVGAPIRMGSFPVMKARQTTCIKRQPDLVGA